MGNTIAGTEERHLAFLNPTLQSPTRFTEREKKMKRKTIIYTPLAGNRFGSFPFAASLVAAATNLTTTVNTFR
jgi:hypothetical protein